MADPSQSVNIKNIEFVVSQVGDGSFAPGASVVAFEFPAPLRVQVTGTSVLIELGLLREAVTAAITGSGTTTQKDAAGDPVCDCTHGRPYHLAESGPCLIMGCDCLGFSPGVVANNKQGE